MPAQPPKCDARRSLHRQTLALVNSEPHGLIAVAAKTNVPISWLRKFAAGRVDKPNANRLQHVFEKLSGTKLLS